MDPRGRKPKRSPEREQAILASLKVGNTRRASHIAAGISHQTFYTWLADPLFLEAVEKAEAEAEQRFLGQVAVAARTSWQAAAWWLERRKHEDYRRRDQVSLRLELETEVRRLAEQAGVDADEAIAEAERILAEAQR